MRYVVPAVKPLTVLHIHDEDREADLSTQPEQIDGWTWCGLPMKENELWRPIEYRQQDRVCPACLKKRGS